MNKKILLAIISVIVIACIVLMGIEFANSSKDENDIDTTNETVAETIIESSELETESISSEKNADSNNLSTTESATTEEDINDKTTKASTNSTSEHQITKSNSTKNEKKSETTSVKTSKTTSATTTTKVASTTATSTTAKSTEAQSFNVTISISCKNALNYISTLPSNGYILKPVKYEVKNGDTVFDLLKVVCDDNSIELTYQSKYYIVGIGGLNEKDCTSSSGWMYKVNGTSPSKAACNYTLSKNDVVEWYYVTSANDK